VQQARPSGSLNVPDTPSKAHLHLKLAPLQGVSYAQPLPEPKRTLHLAVKLNQWNKADWILPHSAHLPVEVELAGGKTEVRDEVSGDWRQVVQWRMIDKREHQAQKKLK
jgi:hypothetical protein